MINRRLLAVAASAAIAASAALGVAAPAQAATAHNFVAKVDINGRAHIGDAANAPGSKFNAYLAGHNVPVVCQETNGGKLWDYTSDKWWVPDEYVKTGYTGRAPGVPDCSDLNKPAPSPTTPTTPTTPPAGGIGPHQNVHGRTNGPAGETTGTHAEKVARILAVARSAEHQGYQYSWGAGGKGGAGYGISAKSPSGYYDYNRIGFDCSGLSLYAYWKGAGIDIGANTNEQVKKGHAVSLSDLEPGDLVFWGSKRSDGSYSTNHVAIYVGNGKVVQAAPPRNKDSIRETDINKVESSKPIAARRVV